MQQKIARIKRDFDWNEEDQTENSWKKNSWFAFNTHSCKRIDFQIEVKSLDKVLPFPY